MKYNGRYFLPALIIVSILYGCGGTREETTNTGIKANVEVGNPEIKDLTGYLTLSGTTFFQKKEIVRAAFQGYIVKLFKTIGDKINRGDNLFVVKTKEASAMDSSLNLGNGKFNGEISIRAKSDGVLTQIDFNEGDYITDGEQIAVIANPASLKINLNVPYTEISSIQLNNDCSIELPEGKSIRGVIIKRIPSVDPAAQTQTFLVDVPANLSLPENLNVSVKIPLKKFKNSIVLPKSAVMSSDVLDEFWIMKLINDSTAVKVKINKGIEDGDIVQILSPALSVKDKIVLAGAYGLPDTANIKIGK
jgi:multidrug efflux pump subunit AcrA (membrane-fusion protein)